MAITLTTINQQGYLYGFYPFMEFQLLTKRRRTIIVPGLADTGRKAIEMVEKILPDIKRV